MPKSLINKYVEDEVVKKPAKTPKAKATKKQKTLPKVPIKKEQSVVNIPQQKSENYVEITVAKLITLPPNTRIAYRLFKQYVKADGKKDFIKCKSAFYKGTTTIGAESVVIIRTGSSRYLIPKNDFANIYVYRNQDHFEFIKELGNVYKKFGYRRYQMLKQSVMDDIPMAEVKQSKRSGSLLHDKVAVIRNTTLSSTSNERLRPNSISH